MPLGLLEIGQLREDQLVDLGICQSTNMPTPTQKMEPAVVEGSPQPSYISARKQEVITTGDDVGIGASRSEERRVGKECC